MTAAAILTEKGDEVQTIDGGASLRDAAQLLDDKRIGAVIIVDGGQRPIGVFSERDLARGIARRGPSALDEQVSDSMTRDVVTCAPDDGLDELMALMTDRRIRHLPVVQNERLIGVISIGDVVKRKIAQAEADAEAMKSYIAG